MSSATGSPTPRHPVTPTTAATNGGTPATDTPATDPIRAVPLYQREGCRNRAGWLVLLAIAVVAIGFALYSYMGKKTDPATPATAPTDTVRKNFGGGPTADKMARSEYGPAEIDALVEILGDDDTEARKEAIATLVKVNGEATRTALRKVANSHALAKVRDNANDALKMLNGEDLRERIEKLESGKKGRKASSARASATSGTTASVGAGDDAAAIVATANASIDVADSAIAADKDVSFRLHQRVKATRTPWKAESEGDQLIDLTTGQAAIQDVTYEGQRKVKDAEIRLASLTKKPELPTIKVDVSGTITHAGGVSHTGSMSHSGSMNHGGNVSVNGDVRVTGNIGVSGTVVQSGTITFTGTVNEVVTGKVTIEGVVHQTYQLPCVGQTWYYGTYSDGCRHLRRCR